MCTKRGTRPVHPGEVLRDEFDDLGLSGNAPSEALGAPASRATMILNGQRGESAETALRLARYCGIRPQLWLYLKTTWELRGAESVASSEIAKCVTPLQPAAQGAAADARS